MEIDQNALMADREDAARKGAALAEAL